MLYDIFDALRSAFRAGLREFRRLRWVRQYTRDHAERVPF
jgi:hypothetical protein